MSFTRPFYADDWRRPQGVRGTPVVFLSPALNGEDVGLEEVNDGVWNILYYETLLGRFEERTKAITGAPSILAGC